MAKLFEYQGKRILEKHGIAVPAGKVVRSVADAHSAAKELDGYPLVVKMQTWSTGRTEIGGVRFVEDAEELAAACGELLGKMVGNFTVDTLLIEKKLDILQECFMGFVPDSARRMIRFIFSSRGGSGIEEISRDYPESVISVPVDVREGLRPFMVIPLIKKTGIGSRTAARLSRTASKLFSALRSYDARSLEVNPLVVTRSGTIVAADCHAVIDDYSVYRHDDLDIDIAREFDRPPTALEKIAWTVEKDDYRGTFYFFEMDTSGDGGRVAFHGAGGGGSMMSMNAVSGTVYSLANFCDTSGNPPASKVYRAARILLSQPGVEGYFASGSGVASQEQFHSARGFVKAFLEEGLTIPAVLRLGGNSEDIAVEILETYLGDLAVPVEGYGKNDSADFCMKRLDELIRENGRKQHVPRKIFPPSPEVDHRFDTMTGAVLINHEPCGQCEEKPCISACVHNVLELVEGNPVLAIPESEAKKGKCTECLACELACRGAGKKALTVYLPVPGLNTYRERLKMEGE